MTRALRWLTLAGILLAFAGGVTAQVTTPVITSINPASVVAGSPSFSLAVVGSGFLSNGLSVVRWNGTILPTTFVSSTQLVAVVSAALVADPGTASITVLNSRTIVSNAATFTIFAPAATLASLSPSSTPAGGPAFKLSIFGTGFALGAVAQWNGEALTTTVVSATEVSADITAARIGVAGTASITVVNPLAPVSNALTFIISEPRLVISSLIPNSVTAGAPAFTLRVLGSGYLSGGASVVRWNTINLPTTFVSGGELQATVAAGLVSSPGTASIVVVNNGQTFSNIATFAINQPGAATLTSLSPSAVTAGGPSFTLTLNGTGFIPGTLVAGSLAQWNGTALPTTFINSTQLNATVSASLIATAGTASITVANPNQPVSNALTFTINPSATATLTSISPSATAAGGPSFTLTLNGAGFLTASVAQWNGAALPTTFVSSTRLTATVGAGLIATPGTAAVTVANPGAPASNALAFTVNPPNAPTLVNITPNAAVAGGPDFTLSLIGTGFLPGAVALWNGAPLPTTFIAGTQLAATVSGGFIALAGTASITAANPDGPASNPLTFTINPASTPILSRLTPSVVTAAGPAFTLTVTGAGFVAGVVAAGSVVQWNGLGLPTTFVSSTELTATVSAGLIASAGEAFITVVNPNAPVSNALTLTINPPALAISGISPNTIAAGSQAFTLTVNGSGFLAGASVTWNTTPLTTTFLGGTQLTAAVGAEQVATAGSATINVVNPGGAVSNSVSFTITTAALTITNINPTSIAAGSPGFTLTVNGTGFLQGTIAAGSIVQWNGAPLATSFVSGVQLTAAVPATLIAAPGTASITVANPSGPATSNAITFTIQAPPPTITAISPTGANVGAAAFSLTVTGTNFTSGSTVMWNGSPLPTSFTSATELTATVAAGLLTSFGTAAVTVVNAAGGSNAVTFTIFPPGPRITSLSPSSAAAGAGALSLSVNGANFASGAVVEWSGRALATTFVSSTQLTAAVPADLLASPVTSPVVVRNPDGTASNAVTFTVNPPAPVITGISPDSAAVASGSFTLTVNGSNLVSESVIQWDRTPLPTTFISRNQLTASVPQGLVAAEGSAAITVLNPGDSRSNPVTFTIQRGLITISGITPSSVAAGGPAFTLTVDGANFVSGSGVRWNDTPLQTSFVSARQLTAAVTPQLIALPAQVRITVVNPDGGRSNAVTLTISGGAPVLTSISPNSAAAGGPAFTLTLNGTNFVPTSVAQWNNTPLATTYSSGTQLTAGVPAGLIAAPGTARITVVTGEAASAALVFTVTVPPLPSGSISGLPDVVAPSEQPRLRLTLAAGYALPITGELRLSFEPDAVVNMDDTSIQFSSGGRTASFTLPANTVEASFAGAPDIAIQAGTVAGTIRVEASLGGPGTPATLVRTIRVERLAPAIRSVQLTRTATGFDVAVTGFSTPRAVTQAAFRFTAAAGETLQNADVSMQVGPLFTRWYEDTASSRYGSQFTFVQSFTVQGDANAIASVSVTLTNAQGTSPAVSSR